MKLKEEFPLTKKLLYFDNAVMGCVPSSTLKVIMNHTKALVGHMKGETEWGFNIPEWPDPKEKAKDAFAKLIHAKKEEIGCVPNATTGINTIMSSIPLRKGENIVTTDLAFPMGAVVVHQQESRGAETRYIKSKKGIVETSDFEKAVDDETSIVYIDHPGWFNGLLFDLKALADIAHDHGAYLVVDATQSIGAVELDFGRTGVDFAATSTYKWLLGGVWPISTGFMYMRQEHIDYLRPTYVTGASMKKTSLDDSSDGFTQYDFTFTKGIRKFEIYRIPDVSLYAVLNSMTVLLDHGIKEIDKQNRKLGTKLVETLIEDGYQLQTPLEEKWRSYINVIVPEIDETVKKLRKNNIVCSNRVGGIRVSPNFYNTLDEVDIFIDNLNKATK